MHTRTEAQADGNGHAAGFSGQEPSRPMSFSVTWDLQTCLVIRLITVVKVSAQLVSTTGTRSNTCH
jgi:hypothetical protein